MKLHQSNSNSNSNSTSSAAAKRIHKELTAQRVGTIGLVNEEDNRPHLSAIYYHIDESFIVSFATKSNTKKHQLLSRSGNVQLLVFDEEKQLTIQLSGIAHEISDQAKINRVIDKTYWSAAHNTDTAPPIAKVHSGEFVAYQILPLRITLASYLPEGDADYSTFESLDFA